MKIVRRMTIMRLSHTLPIGNIGCLSQNILAGDWRLRRSPNSIEISVNIVIIHNGNRTNSPNTLNHTRFTIILLNEKVYTGKREKRFNRQKQKRKIPATEVNWDRMFLRNKLPSQFPKRRYISMRQVSWLPGVAILLPHLLIRMDNGHEVSFPVTVAEPRRILTGFPFQPLFSGHPTKLCLKKIIEDSPLAIKRTRGSV